MPQKLIDQTTIQPDGRPGDDAFTAFGKCNDNFQDAEQRLSDLEGGSSNIGQDVADLKAGLQQEMQARSQGDQALQSAVNAADGKATDAGTAAANAQATADAANLGASRAAVRSGDTFTGPTRVNASFKVQTVANQNMLRFFNSGAGTTALQSVTSDEASFAPLELRGTSVTITGTNAFISGTTVRLDTTQLYVVGPAIPAGQYQGYLLQSLEGRPGANADKFSTHYYRSNGSTGTSWSDFTWRLFRQVDATVQQFMEYQPNGDIYFQCGTGTGGNVRFSSTGVLTASGGVSGGGSDPRIKDTASLRTIENATDALLGLNTRIGRYLEGFGDGGLADRAFVMADDAMRQNTPEVILENAIDGQYAAWATDQLIAYLVAAHQERQAREVATAERISALESRLAALETAMANATPANQPE